MKTNGEILRFPQYFGFNSIPVAILFVFALRIFIFYRNFSCSTIDNRLQTEDWSSKRIIIQCSPVLCIRRDSLADAAHFGKINRTFHFMQIPSAITTFDSSRNRIACGYFFSSIFIFISSDWNCSENSSVFTKPRDQRYDYTFYIF